LKVDAAKVSGLPVCGNDFTAGLPALPVNGMELAVKNHSSTIKNH
jgi:hypothetical protein